MVLSAPTAVLAGVDVTNLIVLPEVVADVSSSLLMTWLLQECYFSAKSIIIQANCCTKRTGISSVAVQAAGLVSNAKVVSAEVSAVVTEGVDVPNGVFVVKKKRSCCR